MVDDALYKSPLLLLLFIIIIVVVVVVVVDVIDYVIDLRTIFVDAQKAVSL